MAKAAIGKSSTWYQGEGGKSSRGRQFVRIKDTFTKSGLINLIAEQNGVPRATAVGMFNTLEGAMLGSVHPNGVGEFTLPGLLKVTLRKVPARKAGTLIRNPATGEMMKGAAESQLASVRVKVRAPSRLRRQPPPRSEAACSDAAVSGPTPTPGSGQDAC